MSIPVAVRLPDAAVGRLDALRSELQRRFPSRTWTRSDALRAALDVLDVDSVLAPGTGLLAREVDHG